MSRRGRWVEAGEQLQRHLASTTYTLINLCCVPPRNLRLDMAFTATAPQPDPDIAEPPTQVAKGAPALSSRRGVGGGPSSRVPASPEDPVDNYA